MTGQILSFQQQQSVFVAHGTDGFYVVLTDGGTDPAEMILGGPHSSELVAQTEAKYVAADFGARLLHYGWGH